MTSSTDKLLLPFQHDSLLEFLISPWPCKLVHQSTRSNFQVSSCSFFFTASFICWLQLDRLQRFFFWAIFFWSKFDLKNMILTSGFFFDKYFNFQNFPDWQSLITRFQPQLARKHISQYLFFKILLYYGYLLDTNLGRNLAILFYFIQIWQIEFIKKKKPHPLLMLNCNFFWKNGRNLPH